MSYNDDTKALENALEQQEISSELDPLQQIKQIRKQQLDVCSIKRSDKIAQLIEQAELVGKDRNS